MLKFGEFSYMSCNIPVTPVPLQKSFDYLSLATLDLRGHEIHDGGKKGSGERYANVTRNITQLKVGSTVSTLEFLASRTLNVHKKKS